MVRELENVLIALDKDDTVNRARIEKVISNYEKIKQEIANRIDSSSTFIETCAWIDIKKLLDNYEC